MMKSYNSFILLAIPFFILSANLMNSAGVTQRLMDLARTMVGQFPGGLGHVNVVVSMIFAGISGSSTAEAAGIGGVMIPAMKKQGYDTNFTVALTACAAVMGVIIPPSILMVVWGGVISVSIGALFLAGVLPGVMIGGALMGAVYVYAKRRGYPVYARATLHEFFCAAWRALLPLATPAIIVGGITGGLFTPTEASVVAVLYALLLGLFIMRTIQVRQVPTILYDSACFAAISLFCIGTASAFGWIFCIFSHSAAIRRRCKEPRRGGNKCWFHYSYRVFGHRLFHRRDSRDYYCWYGSGTAGQKRRHASTALRNHRSHIDCIRPSDPPLRPLSNDLMCSWGNNDCGGIQGHNDSTQPYASCFALRHTCSGCHPSAAAGYYAEIRKVTFAITVGAHVGEC